MDDYNQLENDVIEGRDTAANEQFQADLDTLWGKIREGNIDCFMCGKPAVIVEYGQPVCRRCVINDGDML